MDKYRKSIFSCLIATIFWNCSPNSSLKSEGLISKTLEYDYGESVYHLTFESDSTLHWTAVRGSEKGLQGREIYRANWISKDKLFITWGEENGTGVSQVLDFEKGKVFNHLLFGRELYAGEGSIKIVNDGL